jgi:hypothetical protein
MARNGSGTYTVPTTFVANTPALAADVNTNFTDVATALTGSLALDGQAVMTGQFKAADGSISAPGMAFSSDLDTGFYRSASGVIRGTCDGTNSFTLTSAGLTITGALTVTGGITGAIPSGVILMWSGSVASIPSGWVICDGTNSTPDLRNRFIIGAGSTYAVAATGGSADAIAVSHTHTGTTVSNGAHTHAFDFQAQSSIASGGGQTVADWPAAQDGTTASNGAHTHTFTTDSAGSSGTNANLPPYYALAFIMKS